MAFAVGGFIGCVFAGLIEVLEVLSPEKRKEVDTNIYFGIYTAFIILLFSAVVTLDQKMEPDIVIQQRANPELLRQENVFTNLQ